MPPGSESPGDDYFNDLSQQPPENHGTAAQQRKDSADADATSDHGSSNNNNNNSNANKQKRIACVVCRKRKLRCDGEKPSCGTCKRLAHECAYDEVRRKSGPKRGYVKALEARLAQVETLLKDQNADVSNKEGANARATDFPGSTVHHSGLNMVPENPNILMGEAHDQGIEAMARLAGRTSIPNPDVFASSLGEIPIDQPGDDSFPWEMISLGLEEPLPSQDVVNELHQIYFDRVHPAAPIIHRPRYLAAFNLSPQMRPPISLRYMVWCLAASISDRYEGMQHIFYERSRKYLQNDEMRGYGESIISVANCQAWVLAAMYEFKNMYFPRAWLSTARACKLAEMMGLHRLDGEGLDVKQCIPPPRDWTEREERRRTFWACFASDRYASVGTGWPMTIDEQDIKTNLPSTEEAFEKSKLQRSISLEQALTPTGASSLSPFSGVVVLACLFGRNLLHLHRPGSNDNDDDLNGEFWKRHRSMEQILLNTSLALPDHLRLPSGISDPNIIFLNMNIHTSAICLHQAAIFKADKNKLPTNIAAESKVRCITSAAQIASIMRMISHMDLSGMSPFMSFCLYVAARVFVQYLKSRPKDPQVRSSLQFLLRAMQALRRRNPLTDSFLVQLDVDLEGTGLEIVKGFAKNPQNYHQAAQDQIQHDVVCAPIFEVRDHQAQATRLSNTPSQPTSRTQDIYEYVRNEPSFDQFSTSVMPNASAPNFNEFSYTMDFDSTGQSIARGPPHFSLNTNNTESPTMDLPSRQRSPFLQNQGSQQKSPFMQSRNNSPFLPSQQRDPMNLNPSDGDGMDTTPDSHSGTTDHASPSTQHSQHASSRTSTSYSPHPHPDDTSVSRLGNPGLGRSTHLGPDNFSSGGNDIFGTRQEFEDFTSQLYDPSVSSGMRANEHHSISSANSSRMTGSDHNNGSNNQATAPTTGTGSTGDAVAAAGGFVGFPDWNLDTTMGTSAQTGYLPTGLTPAGSGPGDWSQMLDGMSGWEGMK